MHLALNIQIAKFEGPMALLLHLIRKEEMDIFDINIYQITQQYLNYIKAMKQLDLEVAGEFIGMAATLIHIKSRMLLPQYNEDGELIENEDPRKELVQKLLEYQKIQDVAHQIYERPLVGRDVFLRGKRLDLTSTEEEEILVEENPLFSLISAYRLTVKNMKKVVHRVGVELQSISERIQEMADRLVVGQRTLFQSLLSPERFVGVANGGELFLNQKLITFLSLLELAKMGFVSLFQSEVFGDIHVEPKKSINREVVVREESYEYEKASDSTIELTDQETQSLDLGVDEDTQVTSHHQEIELDKIETEYKLEENDEAEQGKYTDTGVYQEYVEGRWVDAATDDDIAAEERRIMQEHGLIPQDESAPMNVDQAAVSVAEANHEVTMSTQSVTGESVSSDMSAETTKKYFVSDIGSDFYFLGEPDIEGAPVVETKIIEDKAPEDIQSLESPLSHIVDKDGNQDGWA